MNKYLSIKLRVISLISMIMVVYLHSYNLTVNFNSGNLTFDAGYNAFIQNFFSQGITRIAVPIFFCISGYLFFLNIDGKRKQFTQKYKKRTKSLLLPYLLWSIWGLFFYFILQLFPQSKEFFTNDLIVDYSFMKILNTIFLNPIPYQLWFLRDLILLVIISPLIYYAIKYLRVTPILILFVIWLELFKFQFFIFSNESIFFFSLGAYFSIINKEFILKNRYQMHFWIYTFLWILIILLNTFLVHIDSDKILLINLLYKTSILIGIIAVWSIYDILMKNKSNPNKFIYKIASLSFFIYAFHEPVLIIIKKTLFYFAGRNELMAMMNYFLAPLITITLSILIASLMKKKTGQFYKLITGGR